MASRDRARVLAEYSAKFDAYRNDELLIRELGSPTKAAIDLAISYSPAAAEPAAPAAGDTPESRPEPTEAWAKAAELVMDAESILPEEFLAPPADDTAPAADALPELTLEEALSEDITLPEDIAPAPAPEPAPEAVPAADTVSDAAPAAEAGWYRDGTSAAEEPPAPAVTALPERPAAETVSAASLKAEPVTLKVKPGKAPKAPFAPGGFIVFLLLLIVIGVPVTIVAVCLGLPFLAGGAGIVAVAVPFVLRAIPVLQLISDILLVFGSALASSAIGLLLAAFGLWVSVCLCWLWIGKVLCPLGRRLCRKKKQEVSE